MMFFRYLRNLFHIADVAVNVDRDDGHGLLRNQRFDPVRIDRIIPVIDIAKDRNEAVPADRMRGRDKGKRRRDDLPAPGEVHRGDRVFQCQMSVRIQNDVRDSKIFF